MKRQCGTCNAYEHDPYTDRLVELKEELGARASGPIKAASRSGYCLRRGRRELTRFADWCGWWAPAGAEPAARSAA